MILTDLPAKTSPGPHQSWGQGPDYILGARLNRLQTKHPVFNPHYYSGCGDCYTYFIEAETGVRMTCLSSLCRQVAQLGSEARSVLNLDP